MKAFLFFFNLKDRLRHCLIKNKKGMGTIEVIIIIAVLVALALIFRNFIMEIASKIFGKIQEKTDGAIDTL